MENYSIEKRILIAFITDTLFCKEVLPITQIEFFTNEYAQTIVKWVQSYYNKYGNAPNSEMLDIFTRNKSKLKSETSAIIETILEHLASVDISSYDTQHSIDLAKEFYEERLIVLITDTARNHIDTGQLIKASDTIKSYKGIESINGGVLNNYTNADLRSACIQKIWYPEDSKDVILKLNGAFGDFIGGMERGWLMAYLAPMKRGKTSLLIDIAIDSALSRVPTLFVSLEMPDKDMAVRGMYALTGMRPTKNKKLIIPIFDCALNQTGGCLKPQRTQGNRAFTENVSSDFFLKNKNHKPCTKCRGTSDFQPSSWYEEVDNNITIPDMQKTLKAFDPIMDLYMRTRSYPAKTITLKSITAHIDMLSKTEGFDTKTLIIDYADLLLPSNRHAEMRHALDEIWTSLKSYAHQRNILIITASQTNRTGMKQDELNSDTISEDIRKIAIVDGIYGLNQTPIEKQKNIMRISALEQRHDAQFKQCYILQDFFRSQFCLDSVIGTYFPTQTQDSKNPYKKGK